MLSAGASILQVQETPMMRTTLLLAAYLSALSAPVEAANDPRPDYVEFVVHDIAKTKAFYSTVFGWSFTDYGPGYTSFTDGSLSGGFTTDGLPQPGGPLMVFYVADLDATLAKVEAAGGAVLKAPFLFPGGRRFHFRDPDGYEISAWSEK
jgi:predicted enzyme related to lactoylglutathione lyase